MKKTLQLLVIVILGACLGAGGLVTGAFASSANLYVASSGNDGNACTTTAPCATINHAISVAGPHSRISVGPGTYAEMVTITTPITLIGQNATIDATGLDEGIYIHGAGAAGASVSGFTVANATFEGILVEQTSNITIQDNVVQNND
ncbi:MAG TPA: DUF1565 domain-containing protein, partial [Dehalococcoidia bacterium]|nr:DUF1565 domain-containing protein [Dehalococcoidia bacterium]